MRMQREEFFEEFLSDFKIMNQSSSYDILRDSILRDQMLIGIQDTKLLKRRQEGRVFFFFFLFKKIKSV